MKKASSEESCKWWSSSHKNMEVHTCMRIIEDATAQGYYLMEDVFSLWMERSQPFLQSFPSAISVSLSSNFRCSKSSHTASQINPSHVRQHLTKSFSRESKQTSNSLLRIRLGVQKTLWNSSTRSEKITKDRPWLTNHRFSCGITLKKVKLLAISWRFREELIQRQCP